MQHLSLFFIIQCLCGPLAGAISPGRGRELSLHRLILKETAEGHGASRKIQKELDSRKIDFIVIGRSA